MSKIIFATAVITKLFGETAINWKSIALASLGGLLLAAVGIVSDRRGDDNDRS